MRKEVGVFRFIVLGCKACMLCLAMCGVSCSQERKEDNTHFAFRFNREFGVSDERKEVAKSIATFVKRQTTAKRKGPYRFYDCVGGRVVEFDRDSGLIWVHVSSKSAGDGCELVELSASELRLLGFDLDYLEKILSKYREHGGLAPTPPFLLRASKVFSYEDICSSVKRGDLERFAPD